MAAEVGGGDGKRRPRIDMTPMVDLGFLLLTFFVLTTTMGTPKAMEVTVPADKPKDQQPDIEVPCQRVLTFILSGEDRVYWYMCNKDVSDYELKVIGYGGGSIRDLVREKQASVLADQRLRSFADRDLVVMIKLSEDATYKNLVDMFDEMKITHQPKYMLMDMEPEDVALIQAYEKDNNLTPSSITNSLRLVGLPGGATASANPH